jgi:hypothetical protein
MHSLRIFDSGNLPRMSLRILIVLCVLSASAAAELRWWKGNLHTHSLWSDGDDYPEMIAAWYAEHGYHFLALSDHNVLSDHERWVPIEKNKGGAAAFEKYVARFGTPWVEQREKAGVREVRLKMLSEFRAQFEKPDRFLMIPAEEISDRYLSAPIHLGAINLREVIPPQGVETIENNLAAVEAQRTRTGVPMWAHINHPNFKWALTAEEMAQVDRERFFEVYNGHPQTYTDGDAFHASTDRLWDVILTARLGKLGKSVVFGIGTDDSHNYHTRDPRKSLTGRGWVMVRADALTAEAIVLAMEAGDFYASSGVTLNEVRRDGKGLAVEIAAEPGVTYTTEFFGTRREYDAQSEVVLGKDGETLRTTRRYSAAVGAVLAKVDGARASYAFTGDELYVRARITSSKPKADSPEPQEVERAWTQPAVPK